MDLALAIGPGRRRRRLVFVVEALLIAGLSACAIVWADQGLGTPVTVGHTGMFPVGSVTPLDLATTFYDPMRRYAAEPPPLSISQAAPADIAAYGRAIAAHRLPLAIGRVAPVPIFLVHDPKAGFLAIYNRDPFRGCRIVWMGITRRFVDPCHGSEYTQVGEHLRGPAPRDLDRFTVVLMTDGSVVIDMSRPYAGSPD